MTDSTNRHFRTPSTPLTPSKELRTMPRQLTRFLDVTAPAAIVFVALYVALATAGLGAFAV